MTPEDIFKDAIAKDYNYYSSGVYFVILAHYPEMKKRRIVYIGSAKNMRKRTNGTNHPYRILQRRNSPNFIALCAYYACENYLQIETECIKHFRPLLNKNQKMAKRLTDTELWDKEWYMGLSPKLKCLVKFVWDKCDIAGIWNANWALVQMYVGEKCTETELLSIDGGKQFVKLPSGKFFCVDFIFFQNGILGKKSPIHIKIFNLLSQNNIPYPYPINRVSDTLIVEVEEKVIVKEEEIVKVTLEPEFNFDFVDDRFSSVFFEWLKFRKEIEEPILYQAVLEKSYKELISLSKNDSNMAQKIVEQSMKKGWKHLYEIKKDNTPDKGSKMTESQDITW